jgi:sigma-B regulation protein RsbU (phosphoserine phosphatase)
MSLFMKSNGQWRDPPVILIVDDARINRELLRLNLSKHGYHFIMATNGQEAIDLLASHPEVDLILLDLVMPKVDGFAFLRWRADHPEVMSVPVIVNSSLDDFNSISQALTMDSYDYFTKPLSQDDLKTVLPLKIRNAVTARRLMSETRHQNETMRRELEMAARYQKFLLPKGAELPGARITFLFEPCNAVGGDYFDFLELGDGKLGFVVADVSGHGVASAMTASIVKALLPGYLRQFLSPAQAFRYLNQDLMRLTQEDVFVTAFAALYDPNRSQLSWCLAGHPPPLYLPKNQAARALTAESLFLGVFESDSPLFDLADRVEPVKPGDRLALYTDGLTEAPDAGGELFGLNRLRASLDRNNDCDLETLRKNVWQDLQNFVRGEFPDDVAFILVGF